MNHLIKTFIFSTIFLTSCIVYSQSLKKEKLYVKFEVNDGSKPYYRGKKIEKKKTIQFNDLSYGSFIYRMGDKVDTLSTALLSQYHFTNTLIVEKKLKEIGKNRQKENPDKLIRPLTKNGTFDTYLIEVIDDMRFVIYSVIWRNEGAQK